LHLFGNQQIVFGLKQVGAVVDRQLKIIAVSDCILRTSLDAVSTKNATAIIDVVNLCVAFVDADALLGGAWIIRCFDVNTFGWASGGAEKTGNTFFAAQLVHMEQMLASVTRLDRDGLVGIFNRLLLFRDVRERHPHSLNDGFG